MNLTDIPHLRENVILAPFTTLKIGGAAEFLATPQTADELIETLKIAHREHVPVTLLGGGSNVLIADSGIKGLTICNHNSRIDFAKNLVTVGSGFPLAQLTMQVAEKGLNTEFLAGIPGTVGGAVRGNAGAWGGEIAPCVRLAQLWDTKNGELIKVENEWFEFEYRHSHLKERPELILLEVVLEFEQKKSSKIVAEIKDHLQTRTQKQPRGHSCGSVFKNPDSAPAGKLIEDCGLKGQKVGGVRISEQHANWFVNEGGGTAADFLELVKIARTAVKEKFEITLEPEFQPLGFTDRDLSFLTS